MRVVGAETSGLDPGGKMAAERGNSFADSVDRAFDSLGHCGACAFRFGTGPSILSAKSDGRGELLGKGMYLVPGSLGASGVVKSLGLFQVFSEIV